MMDNPTSSNKHPLVPPNEQKCVWMTAGILSYQLCDRQFDCDHCPLDSALRTFPDRTNVDQRQTATTVESKNKRTLSPGYLYSRKHCWIKSNEGNSVRVGIEPLLSSMLLNSKTVVLPSVGDRVEADKVCAWVVLEGGTLAIASPLDGEVQRTNAALVDQSHDIRDDPFERGWLFELTTGEDIFNLSSLLRVAEADKYYTEDERRFQSLVGTELKKHHAEAGVTLADGGKLNQDVAAMLGPEKFFLLLRNAFA
jgi:glycine cleavage system H protein